MLLLVCYRVLCIVKLALQALALLQQLPAAAAYGKSRRALVIHQVPLGVKVHCHNVMRMISAIR